MGIDGLGVAWLAGQVAVAGVIGAGYLWPDQLARARETGLQALSRARTRGVSAGRRVSTLTAQRQALAELRRDPTRRTWVVQRHLPALNDIAVSLLGPRGDSPVAVLKRATTARGARALRAGAAATEEVRAVAGSESWADQIPAILARGETGGQPYVAESYLAGYSGERLLAREEGHRWLLVAAEAAIWPLHDRTRTEVVVDDALLTEWIDEPIARILDAVGRHSAIVRAPDALLRLRTNLRSELSGKWVRAGRVHGDLCPQNLVTDAGGLITGVLDWESSKDLALPQLDLLHLMITCRMETDGRELGDVAAELMEEPDWRPAEADALRAVRRRDSKLADSLPALVGLSWLSHVAANVAKADRYADSRTWVRRNIDPVLRAALRQPLPAGAAPIVLPAPARPPRVATRAAAGVGTAVAGLGTAIGLWAMSLGQFDLGAMGDLGLVDVLPAAFVAALLVLTISFAALLYRRPLRPGLLLAHVGALIAFLHATPILLYDTLRYSWAWKHVGIVDYIQRRGDVDRHSAYLDVYHNWPGFFGLDSLLVELGGLGTRSRSRCGARSCSTC